MAAAAQKSHVVVVGAGVGGLAAAIRLLAAGHRVTVLERAAHPGGKMRQISVGGQLFDGGPSVLTMPQVLDELCAVAGVRRQDLLQLTPLAPVCRHFFADGSLLDLFADEPMDPSRQSADAAWARSTEEIRRVIGAKSAAQYQRFRRHAAAIYRSVERPFLRSALPRSPLALPFTHRLRDAIGLMRLDSRRTLWQALGDFFDDERLRVLFARYATYSGGDPFTAPATLAVIPHVELAFGVYAVTGGMYRVAEALAALIIRLGGELRTNAEVERIELDKNEQRAVAVEVGGERILADCVVVNSEVAHLHARLLATTRSGARLRQSVEALPPSLSAHLNLCVAHGAAALPLRHHNVFFSSDYQREFAELKQGSAADSTLYLCNPDFAQPTQRWFFLTNAPPLPTPSTSPRPLLDRTLGQQGILCDALIRAELEVTPSDFADLFPHSHGALYGAAASSRMAAFRRPPNRVPGIHNLFCVGGSTHPGAGVPMVMLSAEIVCGMIAKQGL